MVGTLVKNEGGLSIQATLREKGKVASKNYRKQKLIPACLYGKDIKNLDITIDQKVAQKLRTGQIVDIDLALGDQRKSLKCVVKDIQYNYLGNAILHIDFMVLVEGRFIEIEVPVEFVGESQGAKKGGIIQFLLDTLTIKVLPDSIPEKIVIDVSSLDIGDSLHIEDLTKIDSFKNVVFVDKLDTPIVTVSKPEESEGQEQ